MYSIHRHIAPIVVRRVKNSKVILLTGPRQVGKSTLFKHLFAEVNRVTFDDDLLLAQAAEDVEVFLLNNPCQMMIDEVQNCPTIFNFFLTGSRKLQLMESIGDSLAGKISILELEGRSLREIYGVEFNRHFVPSADDYTSERDKHLILGRFYTAKGRSIRLDETPLDSCGHGMTAHIQFVLFFTASFIFGFLRQFQC